MTMSDLALLESSDNEINTKKLFVFLAGKVLFSLPLKVVFEIREDLELVDLPWNQNGIIGAIDYRGALIPVIDPVKMVNLNENNEKSRHSAFILCEVDGWKIAFKIEKFHKIITDESEEEEKNDAEGQKFISGITILDKKSLIMLDMLEITNFFKKKVKKQVVTGLAKKKKEEDKLDKTKSESVKSICFNIDKVQFVVPISEVLEVLENQSVTPLFKVSPALRGLINLRGRVVPCIDISGYLNLNPRNLNEYTQFILIGYENLEVALCVDTVNKMKDFPNSEIQGNIDSLPASIREYTTGILKAQKQTLLMLSSKNIILSKELQQYWNSDNI
jgi:purine-binding chemotaxis protein CheW